MPQLKINRGDIAKIAVGGREYEVRDGVVDVHSDHVPGAMSLGFRWPTPEPVIEVGKDLAKEPVKPEQAELPKAAAPAKSTSAK